jgi:ParB-like chromosome segregation protein Spo0J
VLLDRNRKILAGHGRYEAAKLLGLAEIPVVFLDHLTEAQAKAFALADNQLHDRSTWNDFKVAVQLKELSESDLDFDIEAVGFELPELDLRIQSLDTPDAADKADEFEPSTEPAISVAGDLWFLGSHRLYCGNALDAEAYATLMQVEKAAAVFTDPP